MSKLTKALTAAAGNAGAGALYVEDVFSTYLYDGNGTTQTITNGIDLSGEGGLVWCKPRTVGNPHYLGDTERGTTKFLESNSTAAEGTSTGDVTAFNADGFSVGATGRVNQAGQSFASWTFRKAEKFFDVVTWTGNGDGTDRYYNHNLNSVPNCVIVKRTDAAMDWGVYHSQLGTGGGGGLKLNTFDAQGAPNPIRTTPSSTQIHVRGASGEYNENGATYIAYLFASDAGGFGDDGDENIIKCGTYAGNSSTDGPDIDLGFEPQFLLVKAADKAEYWVMVDTMRGITGSTTDPWFAPNVGDAEYDDKYFEVKPTGFKPVTVDSRLNGSGYNYIYIAIRRPMKTPESGTEVFAMDTQDSTDPAFDSPFPPDMALRWSTSGGSYYPQLASRLTGNKYQVTHVSTGEYSDTFWNLWGQDGVGTSGSDNSNVFCSMFKRATGFFDVVAYTGDGTSNRSINHNLGVTPELIIGRVRSGQTDYGGVWQTSLGNQGLYFAFGNSAGVTLVAEGHTSSIFKVGNGYGINNVSTLPHISYLFATLAGVSKVGSYTGTGSNVDVDCGFSAGARFILIKRTDSSGSWYVWDSARGIVAGDDPYFLINSSAAQVNNTDYIDPLASGFTVTSSAPTALNASGGNYIFLAIA